MQTPLHSRCVHLRPSRFIVTRLFLLSAIIAFAAIACEAATPATMTSPTPGSTLPGSSVTFKWNAGSGNSMYRLAVGVSQGWWNIYNAQTTSTSATVNKLPTNGTTIWVRLYSRTASTGCWCNAKTYSYKAASGTGSTVAVAISPQSVTLAPGGSQTFTATVTGTTNTAVTWSTTGGTVSGSGASITYAAPSTAGTYTLTATSAADSTKSARATITDTAPTTPTVSASANPASGVAPLSTTLQAIASETNGTITSYSWNFGDGTSGTGASVSHTYASAGTYNAVVTVTDAKGVTASSAVSVTATTQSGSAQYVTGDTIYPYSTQAQPASKGASFVDSTYHLPVKRVTTTAADRGSYGTITEYPTFDPSSADGKYLILEDCGSQAAYTGGNCGGYVLYDAQTLQYSRSLSGSGNPLSGWDGQEPDVRWNRGTYNAHAFVYRKHMQLREYNVDTQADALVHDFSADFPTLKAATDSAAGYYVYCHEYCSPSSDSRYYSFYIQNSASPYDVKYAFVYDRAQNAVVGKKDISAAPDGMKGVSMSPSGGYIIVNYFCNSGDTTQEMCGPTAYKRDFSSWVKAGNYPDHMGYVWTKQGHEAIFMISSGTDQAEFTRLDTGQTYQVYPAANMDYPSILYTYQNNPGWMFAGTYGGSFNKAVWSNQSNAGPGQIFAFEVDETKCDAWYDNYTNAHNRTSSHSCATSTPRIWRIAFTQNIYQGSSPYFMQVNPQINFAGTKIWFGSNWRNASNAPEVYEVDLPSTWVNDLANLP